MEADANITPIDTNNLTDYNKTTMMTMSRNEARELLDNLLGGESDDDNIISAFIDLLDKQQGDCADGDPRYIILKIQESINDK